MKNAKILIGMSLALCIIAVTQVAMCEEILGQPLFIYKESPTIHKFIAHSAAPIYHPSKIDSSDLTMGFRSWASNVWSGSGMNGRCMAGVINYARQGNFWGAVGYGLTCPNRVYSY